MARAAHPIGQSGPARLYPDGKEMIMGLFGPSKAQQSRDIIARHAKQDKKAKKARDREKAANQEFGRRGRGIVCGWAAEDK